MYAKDGGRPAAGAPVMLTEAAGKRLLREAGIVVPAGLHATTWTDVEERGWPSLPSFPVAVKAQVPAGGRGKAGGVLRCADPEELRHGVEQVLQLRFRGEQPGGVLIEAWLDIRREVYVSLVVDPAAGGYSALYAPDGGVDIESSAALIRYPFGRLADYRAYRMRELLRAVEADGRLVERVIGVMSQLVRLAAGRECTTIEINPLAVLADGRLVAADAKVVLDDCAAFRQPHTREHLEQRLGQQDASVRRCGEAKLAFVPLDGTVGLISGGAGMTMAAMDSVADAGLSAACFLDISGNPTPGGLAVALDLLAERPGIEAILVSIFGGGLFVDRIAATLLRLLDEGRCAKPVVFRLAGAGRDAATNALAEAGQINHDTLEDAVRAVAHRLGRVA